jgi:transcriptional regulator
MYLPPQFNAPDMAHAARVMREHAFASLISTDDDGLPFITHLPLHLEQRDSELVLLGHIAKPNPHWRYLQSRSNTSSKTYTQ